MVLKVLDFEDLKGKGNFFLHGDLICRYIYVWIYIWHVCRRLMHYKHKT